MNGPVKPCKGGAYSFTPQKPMQLDLKILERKLEENGFEITHSLEVMLITEKRIETSIFPSGKMVFKTDDGDLSSQEYDDIRKVIDSIS